MSWFTDLTGVVEQSPEHVRSQIRVEGDCLVVPSGDRLAFGRLETPTLGELRSQSSAIPPAGDGLKVRELIGDVRTLHADKNNAGALFQVASQFNLLEMVSPSATPERGVGIYEHDPTQGPACAISCGAGTIYRNYFAPVDDAVGQTADRQMDCAAHLGELLGNASGELWTMQNGYLLPTDSGLQQITTKLQMADEDERDRYRESLQVGLQWDAAVTLPGCKHRVNQAYCSAVPVAYSRQRTVQWAELAQLVLQAAYEATICAAIINESNKLFLTLLGGGAFGNEDAWIIGAIERAVIRYREHDLDIAIVSHSRSKQAVTDLVARLNE